MEKVCILRELLLTVFVTCRVGLWVKISWAYFKLKSSSFYGEDGDENGLYHIRRNCWEYRPHIH